MNDEFNKLELSARATNALSNVWYAGANHVFCPSKTIKELKTLLPELKKIKGIGPVVYEEICEEVERVLAGRPSCYHGSLRVESILKEGLRATTGRWAQWAPVGSVKTPNSAKHIRAELEKLGWVRAEHDPWLMSCAGGSASWDAKSKMFFLVMGKAPRDDRRGPQAPLPTPALHTLEDVESRNADFDFRRLKVPGGWVYITRGAESGELASAFVPEAL